MIWRIFRLQQSSLQNNQNIFLRKQNAGQNGESCEIYFLSSIVIQWYPLQEEDQHIRNIFFRWRFY